MPVNVKEFKVNIGKIDNGRQQALDFINKDLTPEQILSICETKDSFGLLKEFRVAVWYKE